MDRGDRLMNGKGITLRREFWGRSFESPVVLASGTAGFGRELMEFDALEGVAAIVTKATTLKPRAGNVPPRIAETRFGLINSIGLANPGVEEVADRILPEISGIGCGVIVNVAGSSREDFARVVERLEESQVPLGYEINVSCPNVSAGGIAFGVDPATVEWIASSVGAVTEKPFSVKLTPNGGDLVSSALAAQEGGARAITVCNTFLGMQIDWRTGRTAVSRKTGGYTSPALLPLVVARVFQVSGAVDVPVMASGGVSGPADVLELIAAGAAMVQVGTLLLRRPGAAAELVAGMRELLGEENSG
jgi:dihydroorotate dehydrogenase (NAD+) catalytic subunit